MANPHHRSKHKTYVQQKHIHQAAQHHHAPEKTHKRAALPLALAGAVAGLLVAYIANKDSLLVLVTGFIAGAVVGYLFGNNIDKTLLKKKS